MKSNIEYINIECINKGFIVSFHGQISIDDIRSTKDIIYRHEYFDEHRYEIWNLLDADLSSIGLSEPHEPAVMDYYASSTRHGVKIALIAVDNYAKGLCNTYIWVSKMKGTPWLFQIFDTYHEAELWAKS